MRWCVSKQCVFGIIMCWIQQENIFLLKKVAFSRLPFLPWIIDRAGQISTLYFLSRKYKSAVCKLNHDNWLWYHEVCVELFLAEISARRKKKTRFAASLSTLHELDLPLQSTVCHFFTPLIEALASWPLWNDHEVLHVSTASEMGTKKERKSTHLENERWKGIGRPRLEVSASQLSPLFFFCAAKPTKPAPDPSAAWCKNEVRRSKTDSRLPAAFLSSSWSDKKYL